MSNTLARKESKKLMTVLSVLFSLKASLSSSSVRGVLLSPFELSEQDRVSQNVTIKNVTPSNRGANPRPQGSHVGFASKSETTNSADAFRPCPSSDHNSACESALESRASRPVQLPRDMSYNSALLAEAADACADQFEDEAVILDCVEQILGVAGDEHE